MTRFAGLTASTLLACLIPVSFPAAEPERPRLIVILTVDQMRNDYIEGYGARWTRGLRRLVSKGARFRQAAYPYLNTVTCAGHATISTGAVPRTHGIILNAWFHREDQRRHTCTEDPASREVTYGGHPGGKGDSAVRLRAPSLAEALYGSQGRRGRIVSLSLKARSAIMLAGARGDVVTWFSGRGFATSTAYTDDPVPIVAGYIASHPVERDLGRTWVRMLPERAYQGEDDAEGEKPPAAWNRTFPHRLDAQPSGTFYDNWQRSPYSDEYLGGMAADAVDALRLGRGPAVDYLAVSFSALDMLGHRYGPRSHEVQDLLARLDVTIGRLLDHLDRRVGRGRYVVALSSDHGVAVIPEQLTGEGEDAGRAVMDRVVERVEGALAQAWGPGQYVAAMDYTNLYFRTGVFERLAADQSLFEAVMQSIGEVPGVRAVLDGHALLSDPLPADPLPRAAALSVYPSRSGDLIIIPAMNWFWVSDDKTPRPGDATTHGSLYPYDAGVPLVLMGAGVRSGQYDQPATPADIAPTLARIAGISLPTATGRVLAEALAERVSQTGAQ